MDPFDPYGREKRDFAYSGEATLADVPFLYALRAAQEAAGQPGGPGVGGVPGPEGPGEGNAGGAASGLSDVAFPGLEIGVPFVDQALARGFQGIPVDAGGDGFGGPGRGPANTDPADPFSVEFGKDLQSAVGLASDLGVIGAIAGSPFIGPMLNAFLDFTVQDNINRSNSYFNDLISGDLDISPTSGVSISRSSSSTLGDPFSDPVAESLAAGTATVGPSQGVSIGRGGDTASSGAPAGESPTGGGAAASGGAPSSGDAGVGSGVGGAPGGPSGRDGGGAGGQGGGGGGPQGAGGCFAPGTAILMADGSLKAIEEIKLGDMVMAYDGETPLEPRKVIEVFSKLDQPVVRLNGKTLVTRKHRFFVDRGTGYEFVPIAEVPPGAEILNGDGDPVLVESIEDLRESRNIHNFAVEGLHTYVANGYRVHNAKHSGGYISESRVPDQRRGDVPEILQEGEFVIQADVVDALGPEFFHSLNRLADLQRR